MSYTRERYFSLAEEKELIPLPTGLLQYSFFAYISRDLYTKAQLAKHPQFAHLPEFQGVISELEAKVEQLLWFVSHGKKDQAEKMLKIHPALLLCEGETRDYTGKTRRGTALQLALCAGDVNLYNGSRQQLLGEGMAEMLERYFAKLPSGKEEFTRQITAIFPEDWEEQEEERHERDVAALHKVRKALHHSRDEAECQAALSEFKRYLTCSEGIFDWNAKLLQAALKMAYKEKQFRDSYKHNLWFNQVIGAIQLTAPVNDAMAMAQGLHGLLKRGRLFKRKLKFTKGRGPYYQSSGVNDSRIGDNLWVDCYSGAVLSRASASAGKFQKREFQKYIETKAFVLKERFIPQAAKASKPAQASPWCKRF